jgi:capsular polysaccharide transport system permease protein
LGGTTIRRQSLTSRIIWWFLFTLVAVVPSAISVGYYGFVASDQYETVAKFTVATGALPKMDDIGSTTRLPMTTIVQNTFITESYLNSATLVERLQKTIGLSRFYDAPTIDWWSRLSPGAPVQILADYWKRHSSVAASMGSGIITLRVRAFTPEDARVISAAAIDVGETMLNELNGPMFRGTIQTSQTELALAAASLATARANYEQARNEEGILSTQQTSGNLGTLLTQVQAQLLKTQSDMTTRAAVLKPQAPQMRILAQRVATLKAQVASLNDQITSTSAQGNEALSQKLSRFATLEVEQKIAEKRYATASATLSMAQMYSGRKMLYLHLIETPEAAEEARYPYRLLNIALTIGGSMLLWLASVNLYGYLRRH